MRTIALLLSLFVSVSESAEPVSNRRVALKEAFSYILGRSDDGSIFAADAKLECAQGCVDAEWCPCTKVKYTPEEFRKAMTAFHKQHDVKDIEMRVFLGEDSTHAYVRIRFEKGGKQRKILDVFTFDDAGKISKVRNALPYKLSPQQAAMFQESWKNLKTGDISSAKKIFAQDAEFHCDKACVQADWCSCEKMDYKFGDLAKRVQSMSKNFTQFKDLTINGQPMMSLMRDADAMKKMEIFFIDKTFFMPYDVGGTFNNTKVPCTPVLKMFSLNEGQKIERGALMLGSIVKPLRALR